MANRRMFSLDVVDTDRFLDMPVTTQALYFHLGMRADDDGFVSSPKRITKAVGCNEDDLKILLSKGYIILFESGVIVISDWNINNWIRPDRKHNTRFEYEQALLEMKNDIYVFNDEQQPNGNQMTTKRHTEVSIGKDSIDKVNINTNCASDNAPKASRSEINEFFERIWKLYPNKKGKGQVSDAKKRKLYEIGYDEISRAIDRYKDGLLKDDWRKPQNGSTFFNSGYVDYLDANYSKPQDRQEMDAEQQRAQWQRNYEENQQYLRKMLGTPRPTQPDDPFQ